MGPEYILNFDGSFWYERDRGGWAWRLTYPTGQLIACDNGLLTEPGHTNNTAEWEAMNRGLAYVAETYGRCRLQVRGDSQLVVYCGSGMWRTHKPHLQVYRRRTIELLKLVGMGTDFRWIPRAENAETDALTRG
jgi:ribonuclease HI